MRPATHLVVALLSLGGLELVAAENAQELKPRFMPKQVKRYIYGRNSDTHLNRRADNPFISYFNSLLQNGGALPSGLLPADDPLVSVPVIISVDANGVSHTITPSPTIAPTSPVAGSAVTVTSPASAPGTVPAGSSTSQDQTSSVADQSAPKDVQATPSTSATSSGNLVGDALSGVGGLVGGLLGTSSNPTSVIPPVSSSGTDSSANSMTPTGSSPVAVPSPVAASPTPTASSSGGLLDNLTSNLGDILGGASNPPASGAANTNSSNTGGSVTSPTDVTPSLTDVVPTLAGVPSATEATPTPSSPGLLDSLTSGVGDLLTGPAASSSAVTNSSSAAGTSETTGPGQSTNPSSPAATPSASNSSGLGGILGPILGSSGIIPIASTPTSSFVALPTGLTSVLIPGGTSGTVTGTSYTQISPSVPTTAPSTTSNPVIPGTVIGSSIPVTGSTAVGSSVPTGQVTPPATFSSPAVPTPSTTEPASTSPTTTPETTAAPTTTTTPTETTTAENTNFVPSSILVEPTRTAEVSTAETAGPTQPAQLPGSISPADGVTSPPADSTLIQIGFNGQLRYSFVATTPLSSSQIFLYVPQGLIYALEVLGKDISMFAIQPYDNSASTGYIATVALAYIPTDKVETLRKLLRSPLSRLYQQPNESVKTLFSMIDPSIPLVVGESGSSSGSGLSSGSGYSGSGSSGSNGSGGNSGNNADAGAGRSSSASASSVGIGVGVVAGAAAYGAGMFWVARRYRKKRQLHRRSSSTVEQTSEGRGAGSLFSAGGRLSPGSSGSGRGQMISAPVMAENSLGWN
ncbi:hypothetical protein CDV55_107638 [Aspergillus turcosus]|uniref:Mucin family signaling protein Msb2 n=1 Tax=Aspergillus turcosus TaxID=1245748 RepID=A0A229X6D0_9EURO|nr:hypothetical protein CDV55_107638 [Aspergillus turcosus]RLL95335.1 hypothetical protein CFD26_103432 [Aspergillus turcosus]